MTNAKSGPQQNGKGRIVVWVLVGLAALVTAAALFTFTANHSYLRSQIESLVSEALGRQLSIDGELSIDIGESIEVRAGKVALAATEWSHEPNLLEVGQLSVSLELASVFSMPLHVERIDIQGIRVYAEQNDAGDDNWTFDLGDEAENDNEAMQELPVRISRMQIDDSRIEYRRPGSEVFHVAIEKLVERVAEDNSISIALDGDINETEFNFDLGVNDVRALAALRDIELDIDGNIGEVEFGGRVGLEDAMDPSRPSLNFEMSGPNVEYLTDVFELPRMTTGALELRLEVKPVDERMAASADGTFGEFDVDIEGFFDDLQNLQAAELSAAAKGPNAAVIAILAGISDFPAEPFDVEADFKLTGSALQVDNFRATVGMTRVGANANFIDLPKLDGASATLNFQTPEISRFDAVTGLDGLLTGPIAINADITAAAGTGATLLATIDAMAGQITLDGVLSTDLVGSQFDLLLNFDNSARLLKVLGIEVPKPRPLSAKARLIRQQSATAIEGGTASFGADELSFAGLVDDQLQLGENQLQLALQSDDLHALLRAVGQTDMDEVPNGVLTLNGRFSTNAELLNVEAFSATLDSNKVEVNGIVKPAEDGAEAKLEVSVAGANLKSLLPDSEATESLDMPYLASAKVDLNATRLVVSNINAELNESSLTGSFAMGLDPIAESLRVDIKARSPNVVVLLPPNDGLTLLENIPLTADIRASRVNNAWTAETVDIGVGDSTFNMKGSIGAWPELAGTTLDIEARTPDASQLAGLVGVALPADVASADFRVVSIDNGVSFERFEINMGDNDISGELEYTFADRPTVDLMIRSGHLDITYFMPGLEQVPSDSDPADTPPPTRLIPDTPIPYKELERLNVSVDIRIDNLDYEAREFTDLVFLGGISDGELLIENASLEAKGGGKLYGSMGIRPIVGHAEFWVRMFGENVEVGLPAETKEELATLPRYDLTLAMISTGNTIREMAAAANGYVKLSSGPGRVRVAMMRSFSQDFMAELLNTVNPFAKNDPYTNLKCTVVLATVENGKFHGNPVLVAQSDKLKIVAHSSIDLATEVIDADINTVAQKGLGVSIGDLVNPYIKIGGTLSKPALQLDKQAALLQGGTAIATGGISILAKSFSSRFLDAGDPCAKALADAELRFAALEAKYGGARAEQ